MVDSDFRPSVPALAGVRLLKVFSEPELVQLLSLGKPVIVEQHANVVIEGELTWGLYLLIEGTVGIYKMNRMSGNTYEVGHLRSGQYFGEMSLIDEQPRSATVRALVDCQLFFISKDAFHQFIGQANDLKARFYESCIQDLVGRLRELDENYVVSQYQLWRSAVKKEAA